ncbi:hypothetical protein [Cohnella caldifontis]|uniref:hypothetical protein n=1 Tax=Cohnella caldifontis TaxID=3027471 RepID=UPI0023EAB6DF|nr:hypothetical protein [Cohnella sp. YIM B05605]
MKRWMILIAAGALLAIAACGTAQNDGGTTSPSASPAESASAASPSPEKPEETGHPLKAAHISFQLPKAWTIQEGEESFAFQSNGTPVGGLDGLGYSDTLEGLLPNGAVVEAQTERKDLPVKATFAKLNLEGQGEDETREELHYYFFLPEQNAVYDLHFDAKQVKEEETLAIAKTAVAAAK